MNLFKRNMFGEINLICYLFGHNFCLFGEEQNAVCQRCELHDERLALRGERTK